MSEIFKLIDQLSQDEIQDLTTKLQEKSSSFLSKSNTRKSLFGPNVKKKKKNPDSSLGIKLNHDNSGDKISYSPGIRRSPQKFYSKKNIPPEIRKTPEKVTPIKNKTPSVTLTPNQSRITDFMGRNATLPSPSNITPRSTQEICTQGVHFLLDGKNSPQKPEYNKVTPFTKDILENTGSKVNGNEVINTQVPVQPTNCTDNSSSFLLQPEHRKSLSLKSKGKKLFTNYSSGEKIFNDSNIIKQIDLTSDNEYFLKIPNKVIKAEVIEKCKSIDLDGLNEINWDEPFEQNFTSGPCRSELGECKVQLKEERMTISQNESTSGLEFSRNDGALNTVDLMNENSEDSVILVEEPKSEVIVLDSGSEPVSEIQDQCAENMCVDINPNDVMESTITNRSEQFNDVLIQHGTSLENVLQKSKPKEQKGDSVPDNVQSSGGLLNFLISSAGSECAIMSGLFTPDEMQFVEKYVAMALSEQDLYARLFPRVHTWIREDKIDYYFLKDKASSLNILEFNGFIKTDFENEGLRDVLNILKLPELKNLSSIFKIKNKGTKEDIIEGLCNLARLQNPLFSNGISMAERIKSKAKDQVKVCIKLTDSPRSFFNKLLITSTYASYMGDERERLQDLIKKLFQLRKGEIIFPVFMCQATKVFHSRQQFDCYAESLELRANYWNAVDDKKWQEAAAIVMDAKRRLLSFLMDENQIAWVLQLPDFLQKFCGGYVFCAIISKGIVVLKKLKESIVEAVECLHLLLNQSFFLARHRGEWYDELALIFETRNKDLDKAYDAVVLGLEDKDIHPISKISLKKRALKLLKRKTSSLDETKRLKLKKLTTMANFSPSVTTIQAVSIETTVKGRKQVFVRDVDDGKEYRSVEEVVKTYYENDAETKYKFALHDEGSLIMNLALACFWDIIYSTPPGISYSLFHCTMQTRPLDWGSKGFYNRREGSIKAKADLMKAGGVDAVMNILTSLCEGNEGVQGVVNWEIINRKRLPSIREFLNCLSVSALVNIALHLLQNHRLFRSGFPDLTLWDPPTNKCLIVEVKGPNDVLSDSQVFWLEKLHQFGVPSEVCRVESLESDKRPLKRKLANKDTQV